MRVNKCIQVVSVFIAAFTMCVTIIFLVKSISDGINDQGGVRQIIVDVGKEIKSIAHDIASE